MIWIKERNILFVHNPKCAGTAITSALVEHFPTAVQFWGRSYISSIDNIVDLAHISISHSCDFIDLPENIFSFGVVRHPYARFRSAVLYLQKYHSELADATEEDIAFDLIDEERIRFDWKFVHFCPQYCFLCSDNKIAVSKLIKFERIADEWPIVSEIVGISNVLAILNASEKNQSAEISDRLMGRVNNLYARDFQIFAYDRSEVENFTHKNRMRSDYALLWPEHRDCDTSNKTLM